MHIDEYKFGRIVIDGEAYSRDVIILPGRVQENWLRREGHLLQLEDLATLLENPPQVLIIGKGFAGFMQVPDTVAQALKAKGMEVHIAPSGEAVALYNRLLPTTGSLAAAIHLTC